MTGFKAETESDRSTNRKDRCQEQCRGVDFAIYLEEWRPGTETFVYGWAMPRRDTDSVETKLMRIQTLGFLLFCVTFEAAEGE